MDNLPYCVVFFDLGNTLVVTKDRSWVPGARDAIAQLLKHGVRLGVISNTGNSSRDELAKLLPTDFDWTVFTPKYVILSSEVGPEKPALEIFNIAVKSTGLRAADCLFCTEDLTDTLAAQRTGMMTARLQLPPNSDMKDLVGSLITAGVIV